MELWPAGICDSMFHVDPTLYHQFQRQANPISEERSWSDLFPDPDMLSEALSFYLHSQSLIHISIEVEKEFIRVHQRQSHFESPPPRPTPAPLTNITLSAPCPDTTPRERRAQSHTFSLPHPPLPPQSFSPHSQHTLLSILLSSINGKRIED